MGEHTKTANYGMNSPEIQRLCASDKRLSIIIHHCGDLSYSLHTDTFAFFMETIVGQMLSKKAADAIAVRLYTLCNEELSVPTIMRIETSEIKSIGMSEQKANYIKGFANLLHEQPSYFDEIKELEDNDAIKRLTAIRGIGTWSAKMYLIFVLDRLDVLPFEDGAFLQVYKWLYSTEDVKPVSIIKNCEPWKPYSSLAARYLYKTLDSGLIRDSDLNDELKSIVE